MAQEEYRKKPLRQFTDYSVAEPWFFILHFTTILRLPRCPNFRL